MSSDITWLLSNFAERVPYIRSIVLLSSDGLAKACHGLSQAEAEQMSAIVSGLLSLARGSAKKFDHHGDTVRQVIVEHEESLLFLCSAGSGSALTVLADRQADAGIVGREMNHLIKSVQPFLATPARTSTPGQ